MRFCSIPKREVSQELLKIYIHDASFKIIYTIHCICTLSLVLWRFCCFWSNFVPFLLWPFSSLTHKGPVTRKMFPFDENLLHNMRRHVKVFRISGPWWGAPSLMGIHRWPVDSPHEGHAMHGLDIVTLMLFNGNIFRVTGPFWGKYTLTKASDAELYVFFDLRLNKRLSKQSRRRWFETPLRPLWRHCNIMVDTM